jgi:hypothetical protein
MMTTTRRSHITRTIPNPVWGLVKCCLGTLLISGFVTCAYTIEKGMAIVAVTTVLILIAFVGKICGLFPTREVIPFGLGEDDRRVVVVNSSVAGRSLDTENDRGPPVSTYTVAEQPPPRLSNYEI